MNAKHTLDELATEFDRRATRDMALATCETGTVGFGITTAFGACWKQSAELLREAIGKMDAEDSRRHKLIQLHHADAMELWKALNDLSFECDGVTSTCSPSREAYNRTFAVMQKHRQAYSEEARANAAGCQAIDGIQKRL